MTVKVIKLLAIVAALFFTSCSNYTFVRTGTAQPLAARDEGCNIVVYNSLTPDLVYEDIGICVATADDIFGLDRTDVAIEEIKECACKNGGNAVFIERIDREQDAEGEYSTRVTAALLIVEGL